MGKQTAVVVTHYDKENPIQALDVIQKDIPTPKEGKRTLAEFVE
jgi:hypothetical protein